MAVTDNVIKGFILDCEARGLTHHTIQTYQGTIRSFLKAYPDPSRTGLEELRSYLRRLRSDNAQGSTLKGHFAALSTFFEYLVFEGVASSNPVLPFRRRYLARIRSCTGGENTRQLISIQQMQLLVTSARTDHDRAILLVLAKTGMRRGEFLDLKLEDLSLADNTLRVPAKAKRSNRQQFIDQELHDILERYLKWRAPRARTPWLWINKAGGKIARDYPGDLIASLAKPLGLHDPKGPLCSRLTLHCLRHFFTTYLFRAGMEPQYIMWLRGDSMGKQSWQLYNHIDPEAVRVEYLRCIPKLLNNPSVQPASSVQACSTDRIKRNQ